ncbi:A-kinase anchor protein 13-like isoform X2 [Oncorhynchus kisutch]|uniref:A-kinase anchor protein 13-like isoform X2 n=1 Tax=Oncorhynchus kisutch TaxID=8019 RepID=UPI0012DD77F7|nr:A-kinase anchor protein 13-like isoform X2 [Oncorhynchus kisutch]
MLYRRFFDVKGLSMKLKCGRGLEEKDGEKSRDKDERREAKARERCMLNGHHFSMVSSQTQSSSCHQCSKTINTKDAFLCTNCNSHVHKSCRESLPVCAKVKMKLPRQQFAVPDSATIPVVTRRPKRGLNPGASRERPWSAILSPEDHSSLVVPSRRHTSIIPFPGSNLSKSISISNIAGHQVFDDMPIKGLRYLSHSTDSLCKTNLVNESTESFTDEGIEMIDSQLMGEFEEDLKELEADSWSNVMDSNFLKHLKKDVIKRQEVIYELMQTEMHHVRTLLIMMEVYSKGLVKELQLEPQTVDRLFPALGELLDLHTSFLTRLLERKRESQQEGEDGGFIINKIGDILETQFSGTKAAIMKRVYGKFCSRHNEAVNIYKELHSKDKRFQAFIRKKMSSSIVRRLGIPECILLVTQRITKYPVLMQRILHHTKENEEDHEDLSDALYQVKEVITAVDSKVNEHEKKRRLKDIYSRTDSKSIMRMKSGQMFAREDLLRGRRLLYDGPLQLKNSQGKLKDVTAMLLSDIVVFLQEKDQKFVFASLDQRSTVLSLQKLIVREVANEEKGLFLITAGMEKPEMVEVHTATKEERNTWMQIIQEAMQSTEKYEDEENPSETEEDKRLLETKAKEMREMLRKKDEQIMCMLEEKMAVFREMCEVRSPGTPPGTSPGEDQGPSQVTRAKGLFRAGSGAGSEDVPKGEPIIKGALQEVETLQALVNGTLGGAMGGQQVVWVPETEGVGGVVGPGPVCLLRRAETFGGFDSQQIHISKNGDKEEGEDRADLRRTESDGVLKKGENATMMLLLKRNTEVLHSVSHIHDLLSTLQAVVVQQDSFIEDQRQALTNRPERLTSFFSSRPSSRHNSLIEQEKQRSLEKHRQETAALQRQQATHDQEKRRREREWEVREQQLTDREVQLLVQEEETGRRSRELVTERVELQRKKKDYLIDLERLRDAQGKLDRDRENIHREMERVEHMRMAKRWIQRTPSSTSDDSPHFPSSTSLDKDPMDPTELSSSPRKESLTSSKGKSLSPFSEAMALKAPSGDSQNQIPKRLLQLAKDRSKNKKDKKKKEQGTQSPDTQHLEPPLDGEIYFC